jgi:hypothetical protein
VLLFGRASVFAYLLPRIVESNSFEEGKAPPPWTEIRLVRSEHPSDSEITRNGKLLERKDRRAKLTAKSVRQKVEIAHHLQKYFTIAGLHFSGCSRSILCPHFLSFCSTGAPVSSSQVTDLISVIGLDALWYSLRGRRNDVPDNQLRLDVLSLVDLETHLENLNTHVQRFGSGIP